MRKIILIGMLYSFQAFAGNIEMVRIQTDADSSQSAVMSIETLADSTIKNISYDLNQNGGKVFSVENLNKSKATIFKKGPVAILEIFTKSISNNNIILMVRYLYNFSIFGSDRRVKQLQMHYVAPSNSYETVDMDTQKVIRNAYAYVRYVKGEAKGIDRIETW